MAGAFLQDALRQQAVQRVRGQTMQQEAERRISRQIIGQLAAQDFGSDMQRRQRRTGVLQAAAGQETQRDVDRTQFEMKKDQAVKSQRAGLVSAIAKSTADLMGFMATQKKEEEQPAGFDTGALQNYELDAGPVENFEERFVQGEAAPLVESPGELDTSLPMGFTEPYAAPETELTLPADTVGSFNKGEMRYAPTAPDVFGNSQEYDASVDRETADTAALGDLDDLLMRLSRERAGEGLSYGAG